MNTYKITKLKNGLRLLTVPMPGVESVTTMILVNSGSRNETPQNNGISHFLEHMAFKGTKKRPSALSISSVIEGVGGEFNAFTDKQLIGYHVKCASKHLNLAIDVLSDILLNSKFDPKEIEKEKGVIIEEINMYEDLPMRRVGELFEQLLYKGSTLGYDIAGSKESVTGLKREDFLGYVNRYFRPENMLIVIAGKFSQNELETLVKKHWGGLEKAGEKITYNEKFTQTAPQLLIKEKKTDQAHLLLGVRGIPRGHKDRFVESILGTILGAGMSSRLFIAVREKRGLAYSIRTEVEHYQDNGYFAVHAGVDVKRTEEAVKVILLELKKIADLVRGKITAKELLRAKEFLKGSYVLELEDSQALAGLYGIHELLEDEVMTPKEIFEGLDKVTAADVQRLASEYFVPERLNLTLIGPFEDKSRFEKLLKSF